MSEKQQQAVQEQEQQGAQGNDQQLQHISPTQQQATEMPRGDDYRPAPIRESRIQDRPQKEMKDSIKVKIELDLEVEVRCPRRRCKKKIEVVFGVG